MVLLSLKLLSRISDICKEDNRLNDLIIRHYRYDKEMMEIHEELEDLRRKYNTTNDYSEKLTIKKSQLMVEANNEFINREMNRDRILVENLLITKHPDTKIALTALSIAYQSGDFD